MAGLPGEDRQRQAGEPLQKAETVTVPVRRHRDELDGGEGGARRDDRPDEDGAARLAASTDRRGSHLPHSLQEQREEEQAGEVRQLARHHARPGRLQHVIVDEEDADRQQHDRVEQPVTRHRATFANASAPSQCRRL